MKFETILLSDAQALTALDMLVNDTKEKYGYKLVDVTDIGGVGLFGYILEHDELMERKLAIKMCNFRNKFNKDWNVFMLLGDKEVCGMIAWGD